jgi:hypothetical protein
MRVRIALAGAGIALGLFGIFRLVTEIDAYDLFVLAGWLIGALVIHDGLLSPVVVGIGVALRRIPPRARRFVQFGLIAGALVTVIALPMIRQEGKQPKIKAILQQNVTANLGLLLGIIAALSLVGYAIAVAREGQRVSVTKSRPSDDQNSRTE